MHTSILVQKGAGSSLSLRPHRNAGLEVVLVDRGTVIWQVEGRSQVVRPGSIFFTLPWQTHGSLFEFEPGHHWNYVVIRVEMENPMRPGPFTFPEAFNFSAAETRRINSVLRRQTQHTLPATEELANALAALSLGETSPSPLGNHREIALATLVITNLVEALDSGVGHISQSIDSYRIAKVIDLLRKDPVRPWLLEEIATAAGLRKSRFCELFLRETGDTLVAFINRLRVEQARRLLKQTDWNITRIAQECGFSSSQYFAKVFRQFTALSASDFRTDIPREDLA